MPTDAITTSLLRQLSAHHATLKALWNASDRSMYLITGKWEELSKLNRTDLLDRYPKRVSRLIHKGDWVAKLKESLG